MNNCLDYIKWRGDLSFSADPLNEVDLACLNMLIVLDFDGIIPDSDRQITLKDACRNYFRRGPEAGSELGVLEPEESVPLAETMQKSVRFEDVRLSAYLKKHCEESTEQFGAVTCDLPTGERIILYKSTDDTFIGWKEDFMMAVSDHLPSQTDGLAYLIAHAGDADRLCLTGHSKGGNLAAYAAIHAPEDLQKRIFRVVTLDSPGFGRSVVDQSACKHMADRILNIVPQTSVVGMLLHTPGKQNAVLADGNGFNAHSPFRWTVERNGFPRVSKASPSSRKFNRAFDTALEKLSRQDRTLLIDDLFELLSAGGAATLTELKKGDIGKILTAAARFKDRHVINSFMKILFDEYVTTEGMRKIRERHEKASAAAKQAVAERRASFTARREALEKKSD